MRVRVPVKSLSVAILVLFAWPALAGYNGVEIEGVPPDQVRSGSISLPGQRPQPILTEEECEERAETEEDCPDGYALYYEESDALTPGTRVSVELVDPNGDRTTGTGTVMPDGSLRVRANPFPRAPRDDGWSPGPGVRLRVGSGSDGMPDGNGGIGTWIRPGIGEVFIGAPSDSLSGVSYEVEFEPRPTVRFFGHPWRWQFRAAFRDADDRSFGQVQVGTDDVALTYPREAPNMSTGLLLGNVGADTSYDIDYDSIHLFGGVRRTTESWKHCRPTFGLGYAKYETTIMSRFTSPGFVAPNEVSAVSHQDIEDQVIYVRAGVDTYRRIGGSPAVFGIGGHVEPGIVDSELSGRFESICQPCAPPEDVLVFSLDDDETEFNLGLGAHAGLFFDINESFFIGVDTTYDYRSAAGLADNRRNPSDAEAGLDTDDMTLWQARVTLGFRLN